MARFAVFLRAVNLGASRRFPMATFQSVLRDAGCGDVKTLLASGQAVVTASGTAAALATRLRPAVDAAAGFDVPLVVLRDADVRAVIDANPFADEPDPKKVHTLLVQSGPSQAVVEQIGVLAAKAPGERAVCAPHVVYLHVGESFHSAKLPTRVPKVVECTARNVATMAKVAAAL